MNLAEQYLHRLTSEPDSVPAIVLTPKQELVMRATLRELRVAQAALQSVRANLEWQSLGFPEEHAKNSIDGFLPILALLESSQVKHLLEHNRRCPVQNVGTFARRDNGADERSD